jgi:hypothetical protein
VVTLRDAVTRLLLPAAVVALLAGACGQRPEAPAGAGGQPRPAVATARSVAAFAPVRHPSAPRFRGGSYQIGPRTRARMR